MTLADQDGMCLSQRMSQVQLETAWPSQEREAAAQQPPWEIQLNARTTFGLDEDSQDVLCSQDFFWYLPLRCYLEKVSLKLTCFHLPKLGIYMTSLQKSER